MRYLGVDQSLNGTGLCLIDSTTNTCKLLTIKPGKRRDEERLKYVRDTVDSWLSDGVSYAAIEGYSYGSIGKVFQLAELGGVLRVLLYERGVPFIVVAPHALKKFITGNSSADKNEVVRTIITRWSMKPGDDNQADAGGLSKIAYHVHTGTPPETRASVEVIHTLLNPKIKKRKTVKRITKLSL